MKIKRSKKKKWKQHQYGKTLQQKCFPVLVLFSGSEPYIWDSDNFRKLNHNTKKIFVPNKDDVVLTKLIVLSKLQTFEIISTGVSRGQGLVIYIFKTFSFSLRYFITLSSIIILLYLHVILRWTWGLILIFPVLADQKILNNCEQKFGREWTLWLWTVKSQKLKLPLNEKNVMRIITREKYSLLQIFHHMKQLNLPTLHKDFVFYWFFMVDIAFDQDFKN